MSILNTGRQQLAQADALNKQSTSLRNSLAASNAGLDMADRNNKQSMRGNALGGMASMAIAQGGQKLLESGTAQAATQAAAPVGGLADVAGTGAATTGAGTATGTATGAGTSGAATGAATGAGAAGAGVGAGAAAAETTGSLAASTAASSAASSAASTAAAAGGAAASAGSAASLAIPYVGWAAAIGSLAYSLFS